MTIKCYDNCKFSIAKLNVFLDYLGVNWIDNSDGEEQNLTWWILFSEANV